jgi:hypothetical protein
VLTIEDVVEKALADSGAIFEANKGDFKKVRWRLAFFHR